MASLTKRLKNLSDPVRLIKKVQRVLPASPGQKLIRSKVLPIASKIMNKRKF